MNPIRKPILSVLLGAALLAAQMLSGRGPELTAKAAAAAVVVTIGKAAASITALPTAENIAVVGKLSGSVLTDGAGNVDGTFAWSEPDTVVLWPLFVPLHPASNWKSQDVASHLFAAFLICMALLRRLGNDG